MNAICKKGQNAWLVHESLILFEDKEIRKEITQKVFNVIIIKDLKL